MRHTVVVMPLMKPISHVLLLPNRRRISASQISAEREKRMKKEDLVTAIDQANITFKKLMVNYQDLKAYLVFSSLQGQCELTDDLVQILEEFPAMISESAFKDKGIKLFEAIQGLKVNLKEVYRANMRADIQQKIAKTTQLLKADLQKIEFQEDTFIEIRFKTDRSALIFTIQLESIFTMQKDPLISQVHTPQSQASIRIVLGTLKDLAQQADKAEANKNEVAAGEE
jgi:hypothetical protein